MLQFSRVFVSETIGQMGHYLMNCPHHFVYSPTKNIKIQVSMLLWLMIFDLLDFNLILLDLQNGTLVIIDPTIIWCRKYGNNRRYLALLIPLMQIVTLKKHFMCSHYGCQFVLFEEIIGQCSSEYDRTISGLVVEGSISLYTIFVVGWV